MRDWEQFVRDRIGASYAAAHADVVRELAGHLEETYEDWIRRGESPQEAERQARAQVSDWIRLRKKIERAREGDAVKNQQIRAVWLPGLLSTIVGFGMLRAVIVLGVVPSRIPRGILNELVRMPYINTAHWLFVIPWVAVLPLAGATGAFASWRAGGRPAQRAVAALFPALVIAGLAAIRPIVELVIGPGPDTTASHAFPVQFLLATIAWVWLPAVSLLLGSLPFLRLRTPSPQTA